MRRVAIVGKHADSRRTAPLWRNSGWEIWCLGFDNLPFAHRRYELHKGEELNEVIYGMPLWERLARSPCPVYMQELDPRVPKAVQYPLDEVVAEIGFDYFASTFAFMLAHAIHERVPWIGIWGVDLNTTEEYSYQRPNAEFLIGYAMGRGIRVDISPRSHLCTAPGRYGWDQAAYVQQIRMAEENQRQRVLDVLKAEAKFKKELRALGPQALSSDVQALCKKYNQPVSTLELLAKKEPKWAGLIPSSITSASSMPSSSSTGASAPSGKEPSTSPPAGSPSGSTAATASAGSPRRKRRSS